MRVCTVCTHSRSKEINAAILARLGSVRFIANKYHVGSQSIIRHKKVCMPGLIEAMRVATGIVESRSILEQMKTLHQRCLAILTKAERSNDGELALRAIREARGNLELLGRLDGTLLPNSQQPAGPINVTVNYTDKALHVAPSTPRALEAPPLDPDE